MTLDDIALNDMIIVLFKVIEDKYIPDLVKYGKIFMGTLSSYRTQEIKQNANEIGDITEACLTTQISTYIMINDEYVQIHGEEAGYNARINQNQCVFCSYAVRLCDCKKIDKNHYRFIVPSADINRLCKDKGGIENSKIIVYDHNICVDICEELSARKMPWKRGFIRYDNFDYIPNSKDIHTYEYALEACFHKNNRYSYQNEYRVATINTAGGPLQDLYIDTASDYYDILGIIEDKDLIIDFTKTQKIVNTHRKITCGFETSIKFSI